MSSMSIFYLCLFCVCVASLSEDNVTILKIEDGIHSEDCLQILNSLEVSVLTGYLIHYEKQALDKFDIKELDPSVQ